MSRRILLVAFAIASGSALSAQTTTTTKLDAVSGVPDIDKKTQTEDVAFRNEHDDRMTVPVRLSGAGPYRFLVDTGADRTAVSREIVSKLKLQGGRGAELHTAAGVSSVTSAKVQSVEVTRTPEKNL